MPISLGLSYPADGTSGPSGGGRSVRSEERESACLLPRFPPGSPHRPGAWEDWRRGRFGPSESHTHHPPGGDPRSSSFCSTQGNQTPSLTESHECLLGRQRPQDSSWASSHSAARAKPDANPANQPREARPPSAAGAGPRWLLPPAPPSPRPSPVAGLRAPSANLSSLRASIFNSLRQ